MSNAAPQTTLPENFYWKFATSADLDGKVNHMVSIGADGRVALTGDGAAAHGWIVDVIKTGATGKVEVQLATPWVKAISGAAFNEAAIVVSDSTARVTATAATGDRVVGIALEAASAANVAVKILPVIAPVLAL